MRETRKHGGFVLTLVIVALGLMGVVMAVLAGAGNSMLFHADRAQVQAVERDLLASGLAWARHQVQRPEDATMSEAVELDVRAFHIPQAHLAVSLIPADAAPVSVRVDATCMKGRQTGRAQRRYDLRRAP